MAKGSFYPGTAYPPVAPPATSPAPPGSGNATAPSSFFKTSQGYANYADPTPLAVAAAASATAAAASQTAAAASAASAAATLLSSLLKANNLSDLANAATARTNLGLGTAAVVNTGTSGATLPLLNGTNTWAAAQTFTSAPVFTNASGTRTALGLGTIAVLASPLPVANGGTADTGTAWTAYTPTIVSNTGSFTSASAVGRFKTIGKTVFFQVTGTITTDGTVAPIRVDIGLPVTASAFRFMTTGQDGNGKAVQGNINPGGTVVNLKLYDGTYPGGNGATLIISGTYESA